MAYPTLAEVKAYITASTGSAPVLLDAYITLAINSFISSIENDIGYSFLPVAGTRNFSGRGDDLLRVDPFVSVTLVEARYGPSTEYIAIEDVTPIRNGLLPYHLLSTPTAYGGLPYYIPVFSYARYFPKGNNNIRVTATWGHTDGVPADITLAIFNYVLEIQNTFTGENASHFKTFGTEYLREGDREIRFRGLTSQFLGPSNLSYYRLIRRYKLKDYSRRHRRSWYQ